MLWIPDQVGNGLLINQSVIPAQVWTHLSLKDIKYNKGCEEKWLNQKYLSAGRSPGKPWRK